MPADRTKKLKDRESVSGSHQNRLRSAEYINESGIEMLPCSSCERHGRSCVVLTEKSRRCGECVARGLTACDVRNIPLANWEALSREEARLRAEREAAMKVHEAALAEAMEGLARARRFEKQEKLLKERRSEMMSRNLRSLDELDAADQRERQEREESERRATASTSSVPSGLAVDPSLPLPLDPDDPFWATLDFGGGMPSTTQGS